MKRKPYGSTPREKISPTIRLKVDFGPEINKVMIEVLKEMCKEDGWFKIKDIAKEFRLKIAWDKCTSRKVGTILTQLGFSRRDRKGPGYYYVWIDQRTLLSI